MPPFNINGVWYNAPTYGQARAMAQAAQPVVVAPVVGPPVVGPAKITPTLTPERDFFNRSKVRFGIGEIITLGFTTKPPGQTAASFGGLNWFVKGGAATVVNAPGNLGTARLTCGTIEGPVTLELRTVALPVTTKATKRFEVVRPNDVVFAQKPGTNTFHRQGRPSAGFRAVTYLLPADVSFYNLEFREGGASYVGSGIFERGEVTRAQLATSYDVIHPIRATWSNVATLPPGGGGDSAVNGSMVDGHDTVSTDTGTIGVGEFTWSIPQLVRVKGSMEDFNVKTLDHVVNVDATGNMTISKGGVVIPHNLNDGDSTY
jgi:hypothetical protein